MTPRPSTPEPITATPRLVGPTSSGALSARDLVNVGVFSALYFTIMFGSGMLGVINPVASLVGFLVGVLLNGAVVALYLARIPKLGALPLLAAISGLLMAFTGHPWFTVLLSTGLGMLGALVAGSRRFTSPVHNAAAYGILSMGLVGPVMPIVWDRSGYVEYVASSMGEDYARGFVDLFSPAHLAMFAVLFAAVGFAAGLFGERLARKHFRRAGAA